MFGDFAVPEQLRAVSAASSVHTVEIDHKSIKFRPPPLCRSSRARQSRNGLGYFSKLPEKINMMSLHSCFFEFRLDFLGFHYFWWTSLTGNVRMRQIPCKSIEIPLKVIGCSQISSSTIVSEL